jgi:hypothetical protein
MVFSAELQNGVCGAPFAAEEKQSLTVFDEICFSQTTFSETFHVGSSSLLLLS